MSEHARHMRIESHVEQQRVARHARRMRRLPSRTLALLSLALVSIVSLITIGGFASALPNKYEGPTANTTNREADPSTMDTYIEQLLGGTDSEGHFNFNTGSRYAGRMWSDKSVFANSTNNGASVPLDVYTDGLQTTVTTQEDFLHVYSALGSSQATIGESPIDLVMVLDVSGSMGAYQGATAHQYTPGDWTANSKITGSVNAMNDAIKTIMDLNPHNRVSVVLFASAPAVLLPLDHYATPISGTNGKYINVTDCYCYNNQQGGENKNWYSYTFEAVTPGYNGESISDLNIVNTNGAGKLGTGADVTGTPQDDGWEAYWGGSSWISIGSNTNMDSGFWTGLSQLLNEDDTTVVVNGQTLSRIPSFIMLGDGDPQYMMAQNTANGYGSGNGGSNWWEPYNPLGRFTLNSAVFNNPATIASTIMRAALMKAAVTNHYKQAAQEANAANAGSVQLGFYSVGIELGQTSHTYGVQDATAILNPGANQNGFNLTNGSPSVRTAYNNWNSWYTGNSTVTPGGTRNGRTFAQFTDNKATVTGAGSNPGSVEVTKEQVGQNINYTDQFFNASSASQIGNQLATLVSQISTPVFAPLGGENDLDVDGSMTYVDPLGLNMEVKNSYTNGGPGLVAGTQYSNPGDLGLLLYGNMNPLVRTAVYDYEFNDAFMKSHNLGAGSTEFPAGWYKGDPEDCQVAYDNETGQVTQQTNGLGSYPANQEGISSAQQAWAAGWVYRIGYKAVQSFVPTLSPTSGVTGETGLSTKQMNTVYTIYRFNIPSNDRNQLHMNPAYGTDEDIPQGLGTTVTNDEGETIRIVDSNDPAEHLSSPGVFALSDIRVWTEDTGDWQDEWAGDAITDAGFDDALYVNIPNNAMPLQTLTFRIQEDGSAEYKTNLAGDENYEGVVGTANKYAQSVPMRLFYPVGIKDELLYESGDLDVSLLDKTYVDTHTNKDGYIEFYSNYYGTGTASTSSTQTTTHLNLFIAQSDDFDPKSPTYQIYKGTDLAETNPTNVMYYLVDTDPSGVIGNFTTASTPSVVEDRLQSTCMTAGAEEDLPEPTKNSDAGALVAGVMPSSDPASDQYVVVVSYNTNPSDSNATVTGAGYSVIPTTNTAIGTFNLSVTPEGTIQGATGFDGVPGSSIKYYLINPETGDANLPFTSWTTETTLEQVEGALSNEGQSDTPILSYANNNGQNLYVVQYSGDKVFAAQYVTLSLSNPSAATQDEGLGNPATTFSPSETNRFYVFQKSLPLYAISGTYTGVDGDIPPELTIISDGDLSEGQAKIQGNDLVTNKGTCYGVTKVNQEASSAVDDATGVLSSNGWYYIVVEYYEMNQENGTATLVKQAVPRQGNQFGSEVTSGDGVHFAEYLVWAEPDLDGEPGQVTFRENVSSNEGATIAPNPGNCVIATKIGGLRVGNLHERRQAKTVNTTQTAAYSYYPTVSSVLHTEGGEHDSGTEVSIDAHLGNNGREVLQNTQTLVTKLVYDPSGQILDTSSQPYQYQVFINGINNTQDVEGIYQQSTVNAIVVEWDDYSQLWRQRISTVDALTSNNDLMQDANTNSPIIVSTESTETTVPGSEINPVSSENPEYNYYVYVRTNDEEATGDIVPIYNASDNEEDQESLGGRTVYVDSQAEADRLNSQNTTPGVEYAYSANVAKGTRVFWAGPGEHDTGTTVYLVPVSDVDGDVSKWSAKPEKLATYKQVTHFQVATLHIVDDLQLRSSVTVDSPYSIRTSYLTKKVTFGLTDNQPLYDPNYLVGQRAPHTDINNINYIRKNTAQFTLNNKQGLLFQGFSEQTLFRYTEAMNAATAKTSNLKQARVVQYQNYATYGLGQDGDANLQQCGPNDRKTEGYDSGYSGEEKGQNPAYRGSAVQLDYATFKNEVDESGSFTGQITINKEDIILNKISDNAAYFGLNTGIGTNTTADDNLQFYSTYSDTASLEKGAQYENTLYEEKTEVFPGNGQTVGYQTKVSYNIEFAATSSDAANQTETDGQKLWTIVTDPIDPGANFYGASLKQFETDEGEITGSDPSQTYDYYALTAWNIISGKGGIGEEPQGPSAKETTSASWKNAKGITNIGELVNGTNGADGGLYYNPNTGEYFAVSKIVAGGAEQTNLKVPNPFAEDPYKSQIDAYNIVSYSPAIKAPNNAVAGTTYTTGDTSWSLRGGTVRWVLMNLTDPTIGAVGLTTSVNEYATEDWQISSKWQANPGMAIPSAGGVDYSYWPYLQVAGSKDDLVYNQAAYQVNNGSWSVTNMVENPTVGKSEVTPGAGATVELNQPITYSLDWMVDIPDASDPEAGPQHASVVVVDDLEPGLDFTGAYFNQSDEYGLTAEAILSGKGDNFTTVNTNTWLSDFLTKSGTGTGPLAKINMQNFSQQTYVYTPTLFNPNGVPTSGSWISYTPVANASAANGNLLKGGLVVWNQPNVIDGYAGSNKLIATTNLDAWSAIDGDGNILSGQVDLSVQNQGIVSVGGNDFNTGIVENPLKQKVEMDPGDGETVTPGQPITYRIYWKSPNDGNGEVGTQPVVIVDPIDKRLDFISASFMRDEVVLTPNGGTENQTRMGQIFPDDMNVPEGTNETGTITWIPTWKAGETKFADDAILQVAGTSNQYNEFNERLDGINYTNSTYDKVVVWNLGMQTEDLSGYVELVCAPNVTTGEVDDQAIVQQGENVTLTSMVENPVNGKTEITPGAGQTVDINQQITYSLGWQVPSTGLESGTGDVIVVDDLESGLDFTGAYFNGADQAAQVGLTAEMVTNGIANDSGVPTEEQLEKIINGGEPKGPLSQISLSQFSENTYVYSAETTTEGVSSNGSWISYTPVKDATDPLKGGLVVWYQPDVQAGTSGTNILVATTNEDAWCAVDDNGDIIEGQYDLNVQNRGIISIDGTDYMTEFVTNPLNAKTEEDPGNGQMVTQGQLITYRIYWEAPEDDDEETKSQPVIIVDPIDTRLDFVSANFMYTNQEGLTSGTAENPYSGYIYPSGGMSPEGTNNDGYIQWIVGIDQDEPPFTSGEDGNNGILNVPYVKPGNDVPEGTVNEWQQFNDLLLTSRPYNYDELVVWNLGEQLEGTGGYVELVCKPNVTTDEVLNQAIVQQGDNVDYTNQVENPLRTTTTSDTTSLSVTKQINGGSGSSPNVFPITVTLYNDSGYTQVATQVNGTYGSNPAISFTNGFASFTLQAGQTVTWSELPTGLYFRAVETDAMGYEADWSATGVTGTITDIDGDPAIQGPVAPAGTATRLICNNISNTQQKVETSPGNGQAVGIGQEITYEIRYQNNGSTVKDIQITDPIDVGLDFVSATIPGASAQSGDLTLNSPESSMTGVNGCTIAYDQNGALPAGCTQPYTYKGVVTWTIPSVQPGTNGVVKLTVRVNSNAMTVVDNQAFVSWDNGSTWTPTEKPENPLTKISLQKVLYGDANGVQYFTFSINVTPSEGGSEINGTFPVTYDPATPAGPLMLQFTNGVADFNLAPGQTITISGLPAGATYTYGEVSVTTADGKTTPIGDSAYKVVFVDDQTGTVWSDATANTRFTCDNVGPGQHKVETSPGDGETVQVGQTVTYRIYWENASGESKQIQIVDPLDKGLTFMSATIPPDQPAGSGLTLNSPGPMISNEQQSITYDASGTLPSGCEFTNPYEYAGTVTWNLGTQPQGARGYVELTVQVNENATVANIVKDQAFVGWDNQWFPTEEPTNPLGGPHKTEITPGDGIGVEVGDTITYQIDYQNTTSEPQTIRISDPIDTGATFTSASIPTNNGTNLVLNAPSTFIEGTGPYDDYTITWNANTTTLPDPSCEFTKPYEWKGMVTWTIPNVAPGATGSVFLTVTVNDSALVDRLIDDQAFVKVGNGPWVPTEEPENPLEEKPHKTETEPGDGEGVVVGEQITYRIDWVNNAIDPTTNEPVEAEVKIVDPLDVGVDFVSASIPAETTGGAAVTLTSPQTTAGTAPYTITYDPSGTLPPNCQTPPYNWQGTVTWNLGKQPAGARGSVYLTVTVNENALKANIVKDQAFVGVNDVWTPTEIPQNPLDGPHKVELTPGDGQKVGVGELITYQITYTNYNTEPTDVQIVDPLDVGLDFVSASDHGSYNPNGGPPEGHTVDYKYHGAVEWTLPQVPAGYTGTVTFTARVNEDATIANIVKNQAFVKVGDDPWQPTEEPENPLGGIHKEEITPGNGARVEVGQEVTYQISYTNGNSYPADVHIVDPLHTGVDFVSASDGGTYDPNGQLPPGKTVNYDWHGTVNWTIEQVPAGATVTVTLTVRVNESAMEDQLVDNQAFVQEDDGPWEPSEEPENPLGGPSKTEVSPGNGQIVNVGDLITYRITYENDTEAVQDIHIVDPIDVGLDFVSASDGGTYDANGTLPDGLTVGYAYKGTVFWTIPQVPIGGNGYVELTCRVNGTAINANIVKDQAFVQVGNGPWQPTAIPENPLAQPGGVPTVPGGRLPKTGDETPFGIYALVIAGAAAILTAAILLLRRKPAVAGASAGGGNPTGGLPTIPRGPASPTAPTAPTGYTGRHGIDPGGIGGFGPTDSPGGGSAGDGPGDEPPTGAHFRS